MSTTIVTPTNNIFLQGQQLAKRRGNVHPAILVVGQSGSGKSRSIKNLPPDETVILNIENKPLTFPGADKFDQCNLVFEPTPGQKAGTVVPNIEKLIKNAVAATGIKYIVIDSFTKYCELLMELARSCNKGYDIFNYYNAHIFDLLESIKSATNKFVIVTAIDEIVKVPSPNGTETANKRVAVQGKVWEGKIEKEFSLVLFTEVLQPAQNSSQPPQFKFLTQSDGTSSAKTPEAMFPKYIDNDLKLVCDKATEYFKLK